MCDPLSWVGTTRGLELIFTFLWSLSSARLNTRGRRVSQCPSQCHGLHQSGAQSCLERLHGCSLLRSPGLCIVRCERTMKPSPGRHICSVLIGNPCALDEDHHSHSCDAPAVSSLRQVDHLVIHVFHIAGVQKIWDVQVHSLSLQ